MAIDPDDILTQYNAACIYSLRGEIDTAFDLLERLLPHANHETKGWIAFQARFCYMWCMSEEEHITVTCQNCGEEITNSRAYFKQRDWECPHCGGSIISEDEQE